MKIAVTTSGNNLDAPMDRRFGRAPAFLIFDTETKGFEIIDNSDNVNAAQGAGIKAAEAIGNSGAGALITGNCGPKAFQALSAAGVKVYNSDAPTVKEALERLQDGKLAAAQSFNVKGHWA